jgi:hypothetical protein
METGQWRDYLSNAIRYWEPRRILYNLLLAAIVVIHFGYSRHYDYRQFPG